MHLPESWLKCMGDDAPYFKLALLFVILGVAVLMAHGQPALFPQALCWSLLCWEQCREWSEHWLSTAQGIGQLSSRARCSLKMVGSPILYKSSSLSWEVAFPAKNPAHEKWS